MILKQTFAHFKLKFHRKSATNIFPFQKKHYDQNVCQPGQE
jgi:hypothetical protein